MRKTLYLVVWNMNLQLAIVWVHQVRMILRLSFACGKLQTLHIIWHIKVRQRHHQLQLKNKRKCFRSNIISPGTSLDIVYFIQKISFVFLGKLY